MMQGKVALGRSDINGKSNGVWEMGCWIEAMHEKEKRKRGKEEYKGKKRNNSKKTSSYHMSLAMELLENGRFMQGMYRGGTMKHTSHHLQNSIKL